MTIKSDTNQNPDHAFRDRLQVMFRVHVMRRVHERLPPMLLRPALVVTCKIVLVDEDTMAGDDNPVGAGFLPTIKTRGDATEQRRIETFLVGRGYRPTVVEVGRLRTIRRHRQRSENRSEPNSEHKYPDACRVSCCPQNHHSCGLDMANQCPGFRLLTRRHNRHSRPYITDAFWGGSEVMRASKQARHLPTLRAGIARCRTSYSNPND